jgi:phage shock protein A
MTENITLEEIKQALEKITPGEWVFNPELTLIESNTKEICNVEYSNLHYDFNRDFIASSPKYIKFLIEKVEDLEHEKKMFKETVSLHIQNERDVSKENESLKAKVEELENDKIPKLIGAGNALVMEKAVLEQENKSLKTKIEELEGNLADKIEDGMSYRMDITELQAQIQKLGGIANQSKTLIQLLSSDAAEKELYNYLEIIKIRYEINKELKALEELK